MAEDLDGARKAFEEAQSAFRMAVFEALRAPSLNRYKLEDAFKKYLEKQSSFLASMQERITELSRNQLEQSGGSPSDPLSRS